MEKLIVSATLAMALAWAAPARADATGHAGGHKKPTHASGHATMPAGKHGAVDCAAPVPLMVAAEHKPGGAHYHGPVKKTMPGMAGSHMVHKSMRGGTFFMAPNGIHHLEALYTPKCGFQVFFYNAFTEPIHGRRFQAMVLVLPENEDEKFFDVMRFLASTEDGGSLHAPSLFPPGDARAKSGLFAVELYVRFPESPEPAKFELVVGSES